jgi:hypothetical protein
MASMPVLPSVYVGIAMNSSDSTATSQSGLVWISAQELYGHDTPCRLYADASDMRSSC